MEGGGGCRGWRGKGFELEMWGGRGGGGFERRSSYFLLSPAVLEGPFRAQ